MIQHFDGQIPQQFLVGIFQGQIVRQTGPVGQVHGHLHHFTSTATSTSTNTSTISLDDELLGTPHSIQSRFGSQRLRQNLSHGNGHIFGGMMIVDPQIALTVNRQTHTGFSGENGKELVQGRQASGDGSPGRASIQSQVDLDGGFLGRSFDRSLSLQSDRVFPIFRRDAPHGLLKGSIGLWW